MPFKQVLQGWVDKAEQAFHERHPTPPVPTNRPSPPAIPMASKPPPAYNGGQTDAGSPAQQPYWRPNLNPCVPVSANFYHEQGQHGWGNNEAQNYIDHPANSFHTPDEAIVVHAIINHGHPDPAKKFTSARLSSHQTLGRPRGCLSARITAPVATGIWPAYWLLPKDPFKWPEDGEIDIMEEWDGSAENHSCLHWGHFNGPDYNKHRVWETPIPAISTASGVRYDFIWDEDERTGKGKLLWLIDGKPVMKAEKPRGTRKMSEFRILINIAVGGNVCQGHMPSDGVYELVVRELAMWDSPPGGWDNFEREWRKCREGKTM